MFHGVSKFHRVCPRLWSTRERITDFDNQNMNKLLNGGKVLGSSQFSQKPLIILKM